MLRFLANESEIRNALSQSLSFHVPLDKGNEGSGNEIVWVVLHVKRIRLGPGSCCYSSEQVVLREVSR